LLPRPRRVPGLLNAPHRGVDDSDQACLNAEPGILVGEFAVGIMEDRLIAQPVDCFASAGGGVCLGLFRLADSGVEAAIPNPRNRAGDVALAKLVEDRFAAGGARAFGREFGARKMPQCLLLELADCLVAGRKGFFVRGGLPSTARKPRL
jgi:hypothetical protein